MSSEINGIGGGSTHRLNQTQRVAPQRAVEATAKPETAGSQVGKVEGFQPTAEFKETLSDQKAGEAKASEILGGWSAQQGGGAAVAGSLQVEGGANTAVNQVHGVSNGVYQSSNGAKPGFTGATVYSSGPPAF